MSAPKKFIYSTAPFGKCHRTVVQMANGKYLEVRRDDVTWTAAFRKANPGFKQPIYNTLHDWHTCIPYDAHPQVAAWKMVRGWAAPPPAKEGETRHWLDIHLSMFMGVAAATEEQLADAVTAFSEKYPDSPFLTFLLGETPYEVITGGDIFGGLEELGHILPEPAIWPGMAVWRGNELPKLHLPGSGDLKFSPELADFLGRPSGSWESVLKAFRAYGIYEDMHFYDALREAGLYEDVKDTGYIFADEFVRTFFGLDDHGKCFLPFSDFRKQMLERGHVQPSAAEKPSLLVVDLDVVTGDRTVIVEEDAETDSSCSDMEIDEGDDSDYVPSESESDSDTDEEDDMPALEPVPDVTPKKDDDPYRLVNSILEFNRRWAETHPISAPIPAPAPAPVVEPPKPLFTFKGAKFVEEEAKPAAPVAADPFAEIHSVFFRVQDELENPESGSSYKVRLAAQFVSFCLRPSFGVLWRSNCFERLQMRATLSEWVECCFKGDEAAYPTLVAEVERFNKAYPV